MDGQGREVGRRLDVGCWMLIMYLGQGIRFFLVYCYDYYYRYYYVCASTTATATRDGVRVALHGHLPILMCFFFCVFVLIAVQGWRTRRLVLLDRGRRTCAAGAEAEI